MAERIEDAPAGDPVRFVVAGDNGAWPDPTADGIFSQLVGQVAALDPPPAFFANLGDFAGPGRPDRHKHYLRLVEPLTIPDVCVVGNHDLDDEGGWEAFARLHGPVNFDFGHGHTRFIALHSQVRTDGPRDEDLEFLDARLAAAAEPNRVVLMHMPPNLDGRFAPHQEWGFTRREAEFLALLREHGVALVCCAHAVVFDHLVRHGVHFVVSGGGGITLCSHFRDSCPDPGTRYHAVEMAISESGSVEGRVIQAFDDSGGRPLEGRPPRDPSPV
jgi:Calcineurin-like phosphoesterase